MNLLKVLEGHVISTIEDKNTGDLEIKVKELIDKIYGIDFDFDEDEILQKPAKEIFDRILHLMLTGKLTGVLSSQKFGKS